MFINKISNSKADTYKNCPQSYKLYYVDYIPRGQTGATQFGIFIHRVFELGYKAQTLEELETIAESIKSNYNIPTDLAKETKKCLKNFFTWNKPLTCTIMTEGPYEVDLTEEIKHNGIIDRVVSGTSGGVLVIDYKTGKNELSKFQLLSNEQLQGYAYAIHKQLGVPYDKITVGLYYPRTNNFPTCTYSNLAMNKFVESKVKLVWEIRKKKAGDFPAIVNDFCNFNACKHYCYKFNPLPVVQQRLDELKQQKIVEKSILNNLSEENKE